METKNPERMNLLKKCDNFGNAMIYGRRAQRTVSASALVWQMERLRRA